MIEEVIEDETTAIMIKMFSLAEFTGRVVLEVAVEQNATLMLNPYFGPRPLNVPFVAATFSVEQMQFMLSTGRMPEE